VYVRAQAAAPLQMLINDVTQAQGKQIQSFASQVLGGANPLTATTTTAPAAVQTVCHVTEP
jgi:hypothetical protein